MTTTTTTTTTRRTRRTRRERARVEFPSAFVTNDSTPRTREGLLINQIKSTRGAPTDAPHNATTNARDDERARARGGKVETTMSGVGRGRASALPHWMTREDDGRGLGDDRPATATATTTTTTTTGADARGEWETHAAPDGRTYYHNSRTRESTYEKPEALMSATERAEASTRWRRYAAAADASGTVRTYWAHDVTGETTWETPKEILAVWEVMRRAEGRRSGEKAAAAGETEETEDAGRAAAPRSAYASIEEAKNAFQKMLAEHGVRASTKWDEVMLRTKADARFSALRTTGERKQCLNEYQMARAKIEREAKRMADKKAREAFKAMLEERRESLGLTSSSRLQKDGDLEERLRDDPRWRAVTDRRERSEMFEDFTRDLRIREQRERQETRKKRIDAFKDCLMDAGVTVDTLWRKIYDVVKDDARCVQCEPLDRLEAFEQVIRELDRDEDEKFIRERKMRARRERKNREAFVAKLQEYREDGVIAPRMSWKSFYPRVQRDPTYEDMCANVEGSRPRELFEDLIDDIEEDIENKLDDFEDLLRDGYKARELFGDTTWEKAEKLYRHDEAWKNAPREEAREIFVKFIAKVFRREQEKERKRREGGDDRDGERKRSRRSPPRDDRSYGRD